MFDLLLLLLALLLAAFCSGAETAFVTASRIRAHGRIREGRPNARLTLDFIEHPRRYLSTVLVGTNTGIVLASGVTARFAEGTGISWLEPVLITLLSLFLLLFCEQIPKHMFLLTRDRMVSRLSVPLLVLRIVLYPLIIISELISILFTGRRKNHRLFDSKAEILGLLTGSTGEAGKLAGRALMLDSRCSSSCMREISTIPRARSDSRRMGILLKSLDSQFSFLLVREKNGESIRGYVDTSAISTSGGRLDDDSIRGLPYFDETEDLMSVISGLNAVSAPAGMVMGSDGQPCGIIVLDDIIDMLLGEQEDHGGERTAALPMLSWDGDRAEVL